VRSRPGEARTILLLHIISVRPSKQPLMVRTFLKVYGVRLLFFVSARTNKRHHHEKKPIPTQALRESVLFIGTQFSNLYTAVDTPARGRVGFRV
jgi:hypothetical protein